MTHFLGYRCSLCGAEYSPGEVDYVCPRHGDAGNLDVLLDFPAIRAEHSAASISASGDRSIWRYLPLLPVGDPGFQGSPIRSTGWTPLYHPPRLAQSLGVEALYLKDDGRNPTASFKDRASAVAVARALEVGARTITTASSGNAGAALAGMAAAAGMPAVILVPEAAPEAKVAQLLMYGATVLLVKGTYDDAFDLTLQASREFGWHCRNTGYNPFTLEGKKTAGFEICEQFTAASSQSTVVGWKAPDWIAVSVGDGNIISGIHKGLKDLLELGWIAKMPKLLGVQAEGSAAVYNAWRAGTETVEAVDAATIADSISVGLPRDGVRAVRAATHTGGAYTTVSDGEILQAMRDLARDAAVFAEPAAAASYAGLSKAVRAGTVRAEESVVVVLTGSGLKDVKSALRAAGEAKRIEPTLEALKSAIP